MRSGQQPKRHEGSRLRAVVALLVAAAALPACRDEQTASGGGEEAASLQLVPCRVRGLDKIAECGTLEVPENPAAPDKRKVPLRIARLPARSPDDRLPDPLFLLAGGPGQSAIEAYPPMLPVLRRLNRNRDILLIDQRGTGMSGPLDCNTPEGLADNMVEDALPRVANQCRATLAADLTQYSTTQAAADLDAIREALGYRTINLYGASYGTRLALEYVRRHGESVRTVVLDGVAPRSMKLPLPMAKDAERALSLVFERCNASAPCRKAHGDLKKRFDGVLASLPRDITLRDPRTAEKVEVTLTRKLFVGGLRGVLYSPELTALLPLMIQQASEGDYQGFVAQVSALTDGAQEMMSLGLFLSVVCAEDVPHITDEEVEAQTKGTFVGRLMVDELRAACEGWPKAKLEPDFADPVKSAVPTLVLSGELDPVTPPRWGEAAVKHLENGRHFVVPGAAHGTLMRGCTAALMTDFVNAPTDEIDADCLKRADRDRPPFFIDFAGPEH